jgi:hypothetical protein
MKISKPSKWEKLLAIVFGISFGIVLSTNAKADLDQAIAYAEAGDVRKGQIELYNISQRAMEGQPSQCVSLAQCIRKKATGLFKVMKMLLTGGSSLLKWVTPLVSLILVLLI